MITKGELTRRIKNACRQVCEAEKPPVSDSIPCKNDCGQEMEKICGAIEKAASEAGDSIKELLDDVAMAVMVLGESETVSLWYAWLDGLEKAAPDYEEMSEEELKNMFARALREIKAFSAEESSRTVKEMLVSATAAIVSASGSVSDIFRMAALASENSRRLSCAEGSGAAVADFFAGLAR